MDIPLAALASFEIKLQIGICSGGSSNMIQRSVRQRRPPEIRMQYHSCGVDHGTQ